MSKILVLAEKPSVGRELARVLGCRRNGDGCIMGDRYIVTWALGHLVTLAQPEYYGDEYKSWKLESLPMMPPKMELEVIKETQKQYHAVKKLLHNPEVTALIIATDAGREGELVARWIIAKAGFKKPIKRLWISSQTDKAIKEGFAQLKDGKDYINLYNAAQGRAEADWLVGLNVTRALTCKYNAQLSAGRVQTPTLALIVAREKEIKKFVPKEYYTLTADLGKFLAAYKDKNSQTSFFNRDVVETIEKRCKGKEFRVMEVKVTPKRTPPPLLYDLTELQRDGNKLYGFSAKQTLNIMQRLYENHKALTYPRTDSRYLTDDIVPTLQERLRAVGVGEFVPIVNEITKGRKQIAKVCINNSKVSDHHAIIPTEQKANMLNMTNEEKRIYMLVVKRFLTVFYPDYEYKSTKIELISEGERFFATGRVITAMGWKAVYNTTDEDEANEQSLPNVGKGDTFICKNMQVKTGKTKPPARYTEATLLTAMENPSQYIEDKNMKEFISAGLGTPATRADIIEKLFSSFYVEKSGNSLVPTSKAMQIMELVPQDLREPLLTAKWEQQLDGISKGKVVKDAFINEIKNYTRKLVQTVTVSSAKYTHDNMTKNICPECGKFMLAINGKKGKMLVCQDRECGYRQNVAMQSNMRCPNCHKKMELVGDGEKRSYSCGCGFREKAETMHQKMKSSASKQDVQQYLRQQTNDVKPELSPMALALAKAMEKKS